jgi:hypothetical protein
LPLPLAPALIVIQAALLEAVHEQPVAAVTGTLPVQPEALTFTDAGEIVGVQGRPACVTVKVFPPTLTVPVRAELPGFAATL